MTPNATSSMNKTMVIKIENYKSNFVQQANNIEELQTIKKK